jgi:hypothetical protein
MKELLGIFIKSHEVFLKAVVNEACFRPQKEKNNQVKPAEKKNRTECNQRLNKKNSAYQKNHKKKSREGLSEWKKNTQHESPDIGDPLV